MEFDIDHIGDNDKENNNEELFKLWTRSKDNSRFISVKYFDNAQKYIIDIGLCKADNTLISSTAVFVNSITLLAYLKSVTNLTAVTNYPAHKNPEMNLHTDESLAVFGGGKIDNKPIARIFKSHYWQNSDNSYDTSAFVWKCAHFDAKESATGAFIKAGGSPISSNSIKLSRRNLAELEVVLSYHMTTQKVGR
jgi:hypothetical protein